MGQIMVQLESCLVVGVYTLIGTVVVYFIASALTGAHIVTGKQQQLNKIGRAHV